MSYNNGLDDPTLYFSTTLWSGDGNDNRDIVVDGSGMQVDLLWLKERTSTGWHNVFDSIRGNSKALNTNVSNAESTQATTHKQMNSNGFRIGNDADVNNSGDTYVAWTWKAGTSFTNDASETGIGTIDSSGSVNTDAGFSIVSYTGNNTNGATIGHGLGVAPKMIIVKNRDGAYDWITGTDAIGWTKYIELNTTIAATTDNKFYDTAPTSTIFTTAADAAVNSNSQNHIAYCFAEKQGYSKVGGSYTGNGNADGTFVYTGFKPAFVLYKVSSTTSDWYIQDNKRLTYNVNNTRLEANNSDAEVTGAADSIDMLSNGFKLRHTSASFNASGATYIYMAFAEAPFVNSNGVPNNAR